MSLLFIFLAIFLNFSISDYGDYEVNDSNINNIQIAADETSDFKYTKEYVAENLPMTYSITYNSSESGEPEVCSLTVAEQGYFSINHGNEELYILNENGTYYSCHKNDNGIFTPVPIERPKDTVEAWTGSVTNLFTRYQYGPQNYHLIGSEVVAGIECEVYSNFLNTANAGLSEYQDVYYIEPDTGICMKYENGRHEHEFECTEFKTENITLPEHE